MTMEIYGKPDEKKKPKIKGSNNNYSKNAVAFITSLLTLFAIGIITKLVILNNHFSALQEQGFIQEYSSASILIYLASLFVLNIFIYELNVKLSNHPAVVGIALATIFSLPGIISSITYIIPLQITIVTVISNFVSIILASYIFEMMWE
ncbi:hypothetical protein KY334_05910 [Candidatus Woesearchaeota archaeon]|nr:hypothetical protein [Candidatus Woesearchaeota archaeon]